MEQIRQAILSGDRTEETYASLPVPESYRAATVHKDEVDMFEGLASRDKDPRRSLHIDEVPVPELAPDEALVAVRPGALRFALLLLLEAAVRTTDGRHVAIAGQLDDRVAGVTIAFASRLSADDFAARTRDAITAAAQLLEEGRGVVQAEAGGPPRDAMVRVLVPRVGAA